MFRVRINFEQEGLEPVILENIKGGQSLLEVCLNHHLGIHYDCGGVCSCSTCHIYVVKGTEHLEPLSLREEHFLRRVKNLRVISRLGCQCLLTGEKGEVELVLPDQTKSKG